MISVHGSTTDTKTIPLDLDSWIDWIAFVSSRISLRVVFSRLLRTGCFNINLTYKMSSKVFWHKPRLKKFFGSHRLIKIAQTYKTKGLNTVIVISVNLMWMSTIYLQPDFTLAVAFLILVVKLCKTTERCAAQSRTGF